MPIFVMSTQKRLIMNPATDRYVNFYTDSVLEEFLGPRHFLDKAEIANLTAQELHEYEEQLKVYRDWYSMTKTAIDKAKAEGEAETAIRIAKSLKANGLDIKVRSESTGLSEEEINKL